MTLGVVFQPAAGLVDHGLFADAGQDVLQVALLRVVIQHVVGRQQGNVPSLRQRLEPRQPTTVVAPPVHGGAQPDRAGRGLSQPFQHRIQSIQPTRRHDHQQHPFRRGGQVAQPDLAFALLCPPVAQRQQAAQPAPALAVFRIGQDVGRSVVEPQARAQDQLERRGAPLDLFAVDMGECGIVDPDDLAQAAGLVHLLGRPAFRAKVLQRAPGPHHPGQGVAVGQAHARVAAQKGAEHQFLWMRRPFQKGEVAAGRQFGVAAHANTPCRYQRGGGSSP